MFAAGTTYRIIHLIVATLTAEAQPMAHECHWPGCGKPVPPAMWGCKAHWFKLPLRLRNRVWATYKPGQEITKTPSPAYVAVALEVRAWIASQSDRGGVE